MTYHISKTFEFSAAHRLDLLPPEHKCSRIHGHGYRVAVTIIAARLDLAGMIIDYAELDPFAAYLRGQVDHRWLGAGTLTDDAGAKTEPVFDFNPTAENLAAWFRAWVETELPAVAQPDRPRPVPMDVRVGVSETGKTWAWSR